MMISDGQYRDIIEVLPILCVDIMIRNHNGEYLLIKRANEPLKGLWWVVGGRVLKGETLKQAATRKTFEEIGLKTNSFKFVGYYEDTYEKNPFGSATALHSVSVVFSTMIDEDFQIKLDYQSTSWKYSKRLPERFRKALVEGCS